VDVVASTLLALVDVVDAGRKVGIGDADARDLVIL
jgi:hypothetical protein